jgi:hypothetical protein
MNGTKTTYPNRSANLYYQLYHGGTTIDNYTFPGFDFSTPGSKAYFAAQFWPFLYADSVCFLQVGACRYDHYPLYVLSVMPGTDTDKKLGRFSLNDASYDATRYSENIQMFDATGYANGYIFDVAVELTLNSTSDVRATMYYRDTTHGGDWIKSTVLDNVTFNNNDGIQLAGRTYLYGYNIGETDNFRAGMGTVFGDNLTITPGTSFTSPVTVTISGTPRAGSTIHYSLNGINPRKTDPVYTGSFVLTQTATVKAQAFMPDGYATTQVVSADYINDMPVVETPVITPASGNNLTGTKTVVITCATSGATFRFTTNVKRVT